MRKTSHWLLGSLLCLSSALGVSATNSKVIEYREGSNNFEGILVTPAKSEGKLPAVLLIPNWMGVSPEAEFQAKRIAELGYTVFVGDIYGKGVRPKTPEEAGREAGKYKNDRSIFRQRLALALETLKSQKQVNPKQLLAVGYCFGGTGVLELARAGADLKGVVSFHGGLDSPSPADGAKIKAQVLALHGADDPLVSAEDLAAFEKELRQHKIDWQLIKYGGAVHSFTDRGAGNDNSRGVAYNASADQRSFEAFKQFARESLLAAAKDAKP